MQRQTLRETIKIRERGQMTWPQLLRKNIDWLEPGSIVEVVAEKPKDKVIIKPLIQKVEKPSIRKPYKQKMSMSWKELKKKLEEIRSWGDKNAKLTEFLIKERDKRKYET